MEEREYMTSLYEIYKDLLNDREREYFEYYFFEDCTLQEIADNNEVSKSYVGKFLNGIIDKLKGYENALKNYERYLKIKDLLLEIDNEDLKSKIEDLL